MTVAAGTRLGPNEILAPIGAGGMGEVFRAKDTKLGREVAIKVLPAAVAQEPERLVRFKREAQVLASLNHPNIAHVYDLEAATLQDGSIVHFLAMEMVEGEDLAERLKRGAIPLDDAIAIAKQIAEGLEEAHERGIIHRDLKPANIKVTPDGKVKVLDFGLAKAFEADSGAGSANAQISHSPTMSRHATEAGMIMGTAAYMSPEQARGKTVDKRSDIWSFGVVLFEMLTGARLFASETVSDTLAAVLKTDPDWKALPDATPAEMRRLLRRCLQRNPKDRLHDIADARIALTDSIEASPGQFAAHGRIVHPGSSRVWPWLTALAFALALGLSLLVWRRGQSAPTEPPLIRFSISDDPGLDLRTTETTPFAISPDGRTIVFRAVPRGAASSSLWVRTLGDSVPRKLEGTEEGGQPAISPDGQFVAFVVSNQIKKVALTGGPVTNLASLNNTTAALAWTSNDQIVFETIRPSSGVHRVSADGGSPEVLIPLDVKGGETGQRRPLVLHEARVVLHTSTVAGRTEIAAFSLDGGKRARLGVEGIQALGVVNASLVWVRRDGAIMTAPFDVEALKVTGPPILLTDRVARSVTGTKAALSPTGSFVYQEPASGAARLKVLDASGRSLAETKEGRAFVSPRLSPDGRRIAVQVDTGGLDPLTGLSVATDLWVFDRETLEPLRLTQTGRASRPEWTPDGTGLIYVVRAARGRSEVWMLPVDRSTEPRRLVEIEGDVVHASMEPGSPTLIVQMDINPKRATEELLRVPLDGSSAPSHILDQARLFGPRISPDGRWVAYYERYQGAVHVRSLVDARALQVVETGGTLPAWAGDSRRLYYVSPEGLRVADLETSPALGIARRGAIPGFPDKMDFDVSRDGRTFVVTVPVDRERVMVAVNWGDELRRTLRARQAPSGPQP